MLYLLIVKDGKEINCASSITLKQIKLINWENKKDVPYFEGSLILSLRAVYKSRYEYLSSFSWASSLGRTSASAVLCSFTSSVTSSTQPSLVSVLIAAFRYRHTSQRYQVCNSKLSSSFPMYFLNNYDIADHDKWATWKDQRKSLNL